MLKKYAIKITKNALKTYAAKLWGKGIRNGKCAYYMYIPICYNMIIIIICQIYHSNLVFNCTI